MVSHRLNGSRSSPLLVTLALSRAYSGSQRASICSVQGESRRGDECELELTSSFAERTCRRDCTLLGDERSTARTW